MKEMEFMWECKCGHVESGKEMPDECLKCAGIESFTRVPQGLVRERQNMQGELEEIDEDFEDVREINKAGKKPKARKKK